MLPFLRPKMRDGWMAVSYAADRFDLAHVRRRPGRKPEVLTLHSRARSGDDGVVLRALRKDLGLSRYHCTTLLADGEYQMLQVEPPEVPADELREALRWRIKEMLHTPAESANIEVLEIPAEHTGRARQVWAVAADRAMLAPRVACFDGAKIALEVIDIPELAQRNIAALFEEENRGLALLSFDEAGGMLSFTYGGELYALRRIEATLAQFVSLEAAQRETLFEKVALEAQRSLDNFDRQFGYIGISRLLVAPLPESQALLDYLREYLAVPVAELDLAEVLDFPSLPDLSLPLRQTQSLKVIGAALRQATS